MRIFLSLLFLFIGLQDLQSYQDSITHNASRLNLGIGYNLNMYQADFRKLGSISNCCPQFEKGAGNGINFAIVYDNLISKKMFLGIGLDYVGLNGKLEHTQDVDFGVNGSKIPGKINYSVDARISSVGLFVQAKYGLFEDFYFEIGPRFGMLMTADFTQYEKIIEPTNGIVYSDSLGTTRNNYNGAIPNINKLQYGLLGGLSYDIFLDKDRKFILTPNVRFNYSLRDISEGITWKAHFASGSISFKYHFYEPERIIIEKTKIDTVLIVVKEKTTEIKRDTIVQKELPKISVDITHSGLDKEGNEIPNLKIFKFEEFLSSNVQPLLSFIFFDDNSSDFIKRLNVLDENKAKSFDIKSMKNIDAIETYKQILNIVAVRLISIPKANITLIGCNSNDGLEKGNLNLSKKRAEKVRDYLTNIWKISPDRIKIESRNLPEKASNASSKDGMEENRRVEITSDNDEILEPLISTDTLRSSNPPTARFRVNINAELKKWKLIIANKGTIIKTFEGNDSYNNIIDWHLSSDLIKSTELWSDLTYTIEIEDKYNQKANSGIKKLPVETETIQNKKDEKKQDKIIDKYSLILFDFNSSQLTKGNKKISDLIKSRIKPESDISIYGYTDRSGNTKRNEQLASERANVTAVAIERKDSKIFPVGSSTLVYDNDLPEGRFYSRTVSIVVETPVKN